MYNTITNQNDEIYVTDMNEMLTLDALTSKDLEALREECVADFVNLNDLFPETSTQGILTSDQMSVLQENTINYVLFNSEIYRLNADNQTEGYLTYSCVDYENGITMVKTITVTIATQSWVLNKVSVTDIKAVNLNESVPSSSTQGVLTDEEYDLLVLNDNNYILFNNEIYRLTTKEHLSGYMSYTCIEYENDTMTIKTITIMTMSKSWTLDDVIVNDQPFIDLTDYYTKEDVDKKIANLVNSAPETLDTLGELATAMQENESVVTVLNAAIENKADKDSLNNYLPKTGGTLTGKLTFQNGTGFQLETYTGDEYLFYGDAASDGNEIWIQVKNGDTVKGYYKFVDGDGAVYSKNKEVAVKEDLQNINMSNYLPLVAGANNSLKGDLYTSGEINLDIGKSLNYKTSTGILHNLITYSNGGYIFVGENNGSDIISGTNIVPSTGATNGCNLGSSEKAWNVVYCNEIYQGGEKVPTKNEILTNILKIATTEDIDEMFN